MLCFGVTILQRKFLAECLLHANERKVDDKLGGKMRMMKCPFLASLVLRTKGRRNNGYHQCGKETGRGREKCERRDKEASPKDAVWCLEERPMVVKKIFRGAS